MKAEGNAFGSGFRLNNGTATRYYSNALILVKKNKLLCLPD
jgi:hypothetical protein